MRIFRAAVPAALLLLCASHASAQVDFSGPWVKIGAEEFLGDAHIGEYVGLPINDAARLHADTWTAERWGIPEHQCEPHPITYAYIGPANLRITPEIESETMQSVAWHMTLQWMVPERTIWMDGRPHPPEWAPHTWMGFSTGKWDGDVLNITTTHIKEGWSRRNGLPLSDQTTMHERWIRHGNTLTIVTVVNDPVYLTEPLIRTHDWELNVGYSVGAYPCDISVEVPREPGFVSYHLPGQNPFLNELADRTRIPRETMRGGAETMRPEYMATLRKLAAAMPPAPQPAKSQTPAATTSQTPPATTSQRPAPARGQR